MNQHKGGIIQSNEDMLIGVSKFFDGLVIGFSLWFVLLLNDEKWEAFHTWWLLISVVSFSIFSEFNNVHQKNRSVSYLHKAWRIILSWGCVNLLMLVFFSFYPQQLTSNRHVFLLWITLVPIEMFSWNYIISLIAIWVRRFGRNTRRVAIIGANQLGLDLEKHLFRDIDSGLLFLGFYDDRQASDSKSRVESNKIKGNIQNLINKAKARSVDFIYITLPLSAENRIKDILFYLSDTTASVYFVPDFFAFDLLRSGFFYINNIPIISIHDTPFHGVDGITKRVLDLVLSFIILIIIALPMLLIALAVKLTSPGPVIFKQLRYGLGGEEINVWKFRSMTVCENGNNVVQAQKNDTRLTPIGGFLRRTSLDELPQFINVLQGRMSIVGPRPHAVSHNEFYRKKIKGYMLRYKVRPGITGLAQVKGFRGETETIDKMENRIKFDLEYIQNWSVYLDLKIIVITIWKFFFQVDAY